MAQQHTETALSVLVEVATDLNATHAARVAAATAILDRGYGRPRQGVEMSGDQSEPLQVIIQRFSGGN